MSNNTYNRINNLITTKITPEMADFLGSLMDETVPNWTGSKLGLAKQLHSELCSKFNLETNFVNPATIRSRIDRYVKNKYKQEGIKYANWKLSRYPKRVDKSVPVEVIRPDSPMNTSNIRSRTTDIDAQPPLGIHNTDDNNNNRRLSMRKTDTRASSISRRPMAPATNIDYQDLRAIMKELIPKSGRMIDIMANQWENNPHQNEEALIRLLETYTVTPMNQRRIIMAYYGDEAVQRIWPAMREGDVNNIRNSTNAGVVADPTHSIDQMMRQQIALMKNKVLMKQLEDTWDTMQSRDQDDPTKALKNRLELESVIKKIEGMNEASALNVLKEYRQFYDSEKKAGGTFLDNVKAMKELGVIGNKQQSTEESMIFKLLQQQNQQMQTQLKEISTNLSQTQNQLNKQQLESFQQVTQMQLQQLKENTMTAQDWYAQQRAQHQWAQEQGYIPKDQVGKLMDQEDKAMKRIERVAESFETIPDRSVEAVDRMIDRMTNVMDKFAQIQEKRQLNQQRRLEQRQIQQIQQQGYQMPLPRNPINHTTFLNDVETQLDEKMKLQQVKRKADKLRSGS